MVEIMSSFLFLCILLLISQFLKIRSMKYFYNQKLFLCVCFDLVWFLRRGLDYLISKISFSYEILCNMFQFFGIHGVYFNFVNCGLGQAETNGCDICLDTFRDPSRWHFQETCSSYSSFVHLALSRGQSLTLALNTIEMNLK